MQSYTVLYMGGRGPFGTDKEKITGTSETEIGVMQVQTKNCW